MRLLLIALYKYPYLLTYLLTYMFYMVSSPETNVEEDDGDDRQMMSNSGQKHPLQSVCVQQKHMEIHDVCDSVSATSGTQT